MTDELLSGKLVADRYRIVRRLGAGGMGTVYVALQEPLGREVALKVVRRELAGDSRTLERFRREALSLSQAHHPHIVTLHDFGELPSGALWFAMELVRGENLRQRLAREAPLAVRKTLSIVRDAAAALAAAHALGIVHRDLKPENILLMEAAGRPDFVKLVDFGVAKLPAALDTQDGAEQLTMRGTVVGTPGYIPAEVSLKDVGDDPRSDLYALGVVWFECLTGRPPYSAPTATALMMMHAVDPVPALPPEVPLPVAGLVQRLLAKDPADRPASAEQLLALVDALPHVDAVVPRSDAGGHADPTALTVDDSGRTPRPAHVTPSARTLLNATMPTEAAVPTEALVRDDARPRPSRARLVAAGVAIAALAGAGVVFATRDDDDTRTRVVDAGATSVAVVDVRDAGVHVDAVNDAGVIVDAGTARDAGVRLKKRTTTKRKMRDGEYVPDLD